MIYFRRFGMHGQFGNQLWQYAILRTMANKLGTDVAIQMNLHAGKGRGMYELGPLSIRAQRYNDQEVTVTYEYNGQRYRPETLAQPDGTDYAGYFQCWKYLDETPPSFYEEIAPCQMLSDQVDVLLAAHRRPGRKLVAVNVRRGDYLTSKDFHLVLSAKFYAGAMHELDDGQTDFVVVSDDIPWCQQNIASTQNLIPPTHWHSFTFMSRCDGIIGSASSFSWWAAHLQERRDPSLPAIFPDQWFGSAGPDYDINELVPPTWTKRKAT